MSKQRSAFATAGKQLMALGALAFCLAAAGMSASSPDEPENIALGKKYALWPAPNYSAGDKKPDPKADATALTDGVEYSGDTQLWLHKSSVNWSLAPYVKITVDLEKSEPISGFALHTAFDGPLNIKWPSHIQVFVSDDGKQFAKVCDLVNPSWKSGYPPDLPSPEGQALRFYEYCANSFAVKGRYVCFVVETPRYVTCDEVKVFRSKAKDLSAWSPKPEELCDIDLYMRQRDFSQQVKEMLSLDLNAAKENALGLNMPAQAETIRLMEDEIAKTDFPLPPKGYRAISPLNELHSRIFKLNAELMRLKKLPELIVSNANRWAPLRATEIPLASGDPAISVEMMANEFRSEALNIANSAAKNSELTLSFEGLPGGAAPEFIAPFQAEFVASCQKGMMIADPLAPLAKRKDAYLMKIPSGMTKQLWLTFNPTSLAPGSYQGFAVLKDAAGHEKKTPLSLRVHPFRFPDQPSLSLSMFDYTSGKPFEFECITEANRKLAIEDMKKHFVNSSWTKPNVACWPAKEDFDKDGALVAPLRTDAFDAWLAEFKDWKRLFIYLEPAHLEKFAGEPYGTPRFERMIAQWATKFAAYAKEKGVEPSRIGLHLMDEPRKPEHFKINAAYAKAVKAAVPEFKLFTDFDGRALPGFNGKDKDLYAMLKAYDIICPHLPNYANRMDTVTNAVKAAGGGKKEYWLYSCLGPARQFDPYYYHRLQAWHCWKNNATGMGFWCYWNYYRNPNVTAWNELGSSIASFGLVYSSAEEIVSGKHWEAVREGVEDYEYLHMLKARVDELKASGEKAEAVKDAERLLDTLPAKVTGTYQQYGIYWNVAKGRDAADSARIEILGALEKLR